MSTPPVKIYVVANGGPQWDDRKPFENADVYRTHEQAVNAIAALYSSPNFKHYDCVSTFEQVRNAVMLRGDYPHVTNCSDDDDVHNECALEAYTYHRILTATLPAGSTVTFPPAFVDDARPPDKLEVYPVSDDDNPEPPSRTQTTLWLVATGKDHYGYGTHLHPDAKAYRTRAQAIDAVATLASDSSAVRTTLEEHSDYPHERFSDDESADYDSAIGHRYFLLVWAPMPPGTLVDIPPIANKDD